MSSLSVYHVSSPDIPTKVLTHLEDIASTLAEHGVAFDRWEAATPITPGASQEEVISAYRTPDRQADERARLCHRGRHQSQQRSPAKAELRARFLEEHRHGEDEVRFFVAGRGLFTLHIDDYVYAVLCEKTT